MKTPSSKYPQAQAETKHTPDLSDPTVRAAYEAGIDLGQKLEQLNPSEASWVPIAYETTPSGKQLFLCRRCGAKDPAPTKYHECALLNVQPA